MMITKVGIVVSDKMNKTRVVKVERFVRVPKYEKVVKKIKKYYAHDENNTTKVGDKVKIKLSRPISKLKRWEIIEVIK
ncbi:MAG: 30S ribosomal protein S17 [Endomicrobia bacterium]|nr:30S ribosomal protein S17 [Endomicrobiia bacterium]MCX7941399.1 30S ribosomal protein S17 [Endomicrobiia bacterium]MDW8055497.1 30S ribosomal protein S17 [Elusimicrobiota bacterium]